MPVDIVAMQEHEETLRVANNYAMSLNRLQRFEEARELLRKVLPVAQRAHGASHITTIRMWWTYAWALYLNPSATLDDLREAVTTLEDTERIARRVLGGAHPVTQEIEHHLPKARAALRVRESPLPRPWEAHRNDAGALYFHNRETGESEWTLPDEILARETPSGSA